MLAVVTVWGLWGVGGRQVVRLIEAYRKWNGIQFRT